MTAAGWYPDPEDSTVQRYWDGEAWGPPAPAVTNSPDPVTPTRRDRKKVWGLVAAAAVVVGAGAGTYFAASGADSHPPKMLNVHGTMTLTDITGYSASDLTAGAPCSGSGGYSDINAGADVVISDDSGKTLVITQLAAGTVDSGVHCEFDWSARVPAGKKFYGVTVTHRGTVKETEAELSGIVALTLGD